MLGVNFSAVAQTVEAKREEPKLYYYHYFDAKTAHDYKGYTVGPTPEAGDIDLVLCGGAGLHKFSVAQLKPDDGPCEGPSAGTLGYASIIRGNVLGVGNETVTLNIQTTSGAQVTTLPKHLFHDGGAKLSPGDTVVFVANQDQWKSKTDISGAFNNWAINSKEKEGTPLVVRDGVHFSLKDLPLAVEFHALDWRAGG